MSSVPAIASGLIAGYPPQDWSKIFLRGVGQVMFQDNALTGLLFLVGIAAGAFEEGTTFGLLMAVGGLIGTVLGTITARLLRCDENQIRDGIYGYNAVAAIALYLWKPSLVIRYSVLSLNSADRDISQGS